MSRYNLGVDSVLPAEKKNQYGSIQDNGEQQNNYQFNSLHVYLKLEKQHSKNKGDKGYLAFKFVTALLSTALLSSPSFINSTVLKFEKLQFSCMLFSHAQLLNAVASEAQR